MYIKIMPRDHPADPDAVAPTRDRNEETLLEGDWIERNKLFEDDELDTGANTIYAFPEGNQAGEEFLMELWIHRLDSKPSTQVILKNALVFIMNDEGKTIDKIYV